MSVESRPQETNDDYDVDDDESTVQNVAAAAISDGMKTGRPATAENDLTIGNNNQSTNNSRSAAVENKPRTPLKGNNNNISNNMYGGESNADAMMAMGATPRASVVQTIALNGSGSGGGGNTGTQHNSQSNALHNNNNSSSHNLKNHIDSDDEDYSGGGVIGTGGPGSSGVGGGGGAYGYWGAVRSQSRAVSPSMMDNMSENSSQAPTMPTNPLTRSKSRPELAGGGIGAQAASSRYGNLSYWKARRILFYKNGDPFFPGVEFRFKPFRDIGSLEALLDKISPKMDLPRGARYVFSMDGDRKYNLDELEDGASYVVSSFKAFKVSTI